MAAGDKQREWLRRLLSMCTPEQVEFFNRMYKSVDEIEPKKMAWAIEQCKTTVLKNIKGMKPVELDKLMRGKQADLSEKKVEKKTGLAFHAVNNLTSVGRRKLTL